jgi:hypothetical protein
VKNRTVLKKRLTTVLTIVATAGGSFPAQPVFAGHKVDKCDDVCGRYKRGAIGGKFADDPTKTQLSLAFAKQECGEIGANNPALQTAQLVSQFQNAGSQEPGATGPKVRSDKDFPLTESFKTGNPKWDECATGPKGLIKELGQVAQFCAAIDLSEKGNKESLAAAIIYGAAATTCLASCVADKFPVLKAAQGACVYAAGAAVLADAAASIAIRVQGEKQTHSMQALNGLVGVGSMAAAGGSSLVGGGTSSLSMTNTAESCLAATMLFAGVAVKTVQRRRTDDASDKNCKLARDLASQARVTRNNESNGKGANDANGGSVSSGVAGAGDATTSSSGNADVDSYFASVDGSPYPFPPPQFAAATGNGGDPFLAAFNGLTNKGDIPRALTEAAGISMGQFARRMANGESLGDITSSLPNLNQGGVSSQGLANLERDILSGKAELGLANGKSMYVGGGGSSKPQGTANRPMATDFTFGMRAPAGTTSSEAVFEKMKRDVAPEADGDIWHEGYGGSIFQIVSVKLSKARDRVDQLEWETPLNRALTGLPSKKQK